MSDDLEKALAAAVPEEKKMEKTLIDLGNIPPLDFLEIQLWQVVDFGLSNLEQLYRHRAKEDGLDGHEAKNIAAILASLADNRMVIRDGLTYAQHQLAHRNATVLKKD